MDLVYVLKDTESNWKNKELLYSLRSVEAFAPWCANVFISTATLPPFLNPEAVIHIRAKDGESRTLSTLRKALAACADDRLSETFVLMNDDMIFLRRGEGAVASYRGLLREAPGLVKNKGGEYCKAARETLDILTAQGLADPKNFAAHRPTPLNKSRAIALLRPYLDIGAPILWNTLYQNLAGVEGEQAPDVKAHNHGQFQRLTEREGVVSLNESVVKNRYVKKWLEAQFPAPSKYERVA